MGFAVVSIVHEDFCQSDRRLDVAAQVATDLIEILIGVNPIIDAIGDGEVGRVGVVVLLDIPRPHSREDAALFLKESGIKVTFDGVASGVVGGGVGHVGDTHGVGGEFAIYAETAESSSARTSLSRTMVGVQSSMPF